MPVKQHMNISTSQICCGQALLLIGVAIKVLISTQPRLRRPTYLRKGLAIFEPTDRGRRIALSRAAQIKTLAS